MADLGLDAVRVFEALGQGILLFDSANRLIFENQAARDLLGNDLKVIRSEGWLAASILFNSPLTKNDPHLDSARAEALRTERTVRFRTYRGGEYLPCWVSILRADDGEALTMITVEAPDWHALTDVLDRFLQETREAVEATRGHADLINQSMKQLKPDETVERLGRRVGGFARLIGTHMHRTAYLLEFMERLGDVRTGKIREHIANQRQRIVLATFVEDFLEDLDSMALLDPESEAQDARGRIRCSISAGLAVDASPGHLSAILRDILRNAIMYSMRGTPVGISARADSGAVLVTVTDEGYGIRAGEFERVFLPFARARQPQILGEFGYGLSLYLCKHEVEAMNGRLWFESEEGVGSTFHFTLPAARPSSSSRP